MMISGWIMRAMAEVRIKSEVINKLPKNQINTGDILNWVYTFAALMAVGVIVYSGYKYTRSEGDMGEIKKSHNRIAFAVIGLIIVIFAAVITNFVFKNLGEL